MRIPSFACVSIHCEGGIPARFLNEAARLGVPLWDVRQHDTALFCHVAARQYRVLRVAARRAGTRMRVRHKYGIVFWLRRHGFRRGLVLGGLLFFVLLQLLSSRIWVIQTDGNTTLSDTDILRAVEPYGVAVGRSFAEVDIPALRLQVLRDVPQLGWVSVNQSGSIVTVHVRERNSEQLPPTETPSNIVAACDGIITELHVTGGQAAVQVGDAVRRGDLLISGVTDSTVGAMLKRAGGTVTARTSRTVRIHIPLCEAVPTVVRTVSRPSVMFFGVHIPLYTSTPIEGTPAVTVTNSPVYMNGVPLPVGWSTTTLSYTEPRSVTRTVEEARRLAKTQLAAAEQTLAATLTVESVTHAETVTDTAVILTANYVGLQSIGEEVPLR